MTKAKLNMEVELIDWSSMCLKKMCLQIKISNIQGSLNKFPDFFRMGTLIYSTLMKL